jgi:hypothetical protein
MLKVRRHHYSYRHLHPGVRYHQKQANYFQMKATTQYDAAMCLSDSAPPSPDLIKSLDYHTNLAHWYMKQAALHQAVVWRYREMGLDYNPTERDYIMGEARL